MDNPRGAVYTAVKGRFQHPISLGMARVSHTLSDPSSASDLSVETTAEHISEKALSIVDACGEGVQGVGYDRATKQATPYQTARIVDSTGCSPRSRLIPSLLLTVQKSLKVLERAYCVVCSFILFVGQVDKEDRRHRAEVTDNGVMAVSNGESQGHGPTTALPTNFWQQRQAFFTFDISVLFPNVAHCPSLEAAVT